MSYVRARRAWCVVHASNSIDSIHIYVRLLLNFFRKNDVKSSMKIRSIHLGILISVPCVCVCLCAWAAFKTHWTPSYSALASPLITILTIFLVQLNNGHWAPDQASMLEIRIVCSLNSRMWLCVEYAVFVWCVLYDTLLYVLCCCWCCYAIYENVAIDMSWAMSISSSECVAKK